MTHPEQSRGEGPSTPREKEGVSPTRAGRTVRGYRIAFLVFCTVAVCLSADLLRLHINVHTDPSYQSYCAMSERVNCETVALSDHALFLAMPVATWGLLVYLAMGALCVWGLRGRLRTPSWPFGSLFWLSAIATVVGIALFLVSHFLIESVCLVCAGTYGVNAILMGTSWMALRRSGVASPISALAAEVRSIRAAPRAPAVFVGAFVAVLLGAWIGTPPYWQVVGTTGPNGLPAGFTADGHPWIGATSPIVTIEEYSDYQCPYCQRGHDEIRQLLTREAGKVRLVHRNYPLDHKCNDTLRGPFHAEACTYARLAYCAGRQRKFWEANDYLFAHGRRREPVTSAELARAVGISDGSLEACAAGNDAARAVDADLAAGRAHKIRGTPTFVVGDQTYPGRIPPDVIAAALRRDDGSGRRP